MGTLGDIWGPQGRPTAPPDPHWATCGAPYGLPEASPVQHFEHCHKDALGHEGICELPPVAHSGTAGCTPPGPPRGHLGTPKTPRTPKKTHRAMWGAPYRLADVMVDLHLKDPIGTRWDTRRPVSAPWWLTVELQVECSPPGPPWGHLGTPKTLRTPQ